MCKTLIATLQESPGARRCWNTGNREFTTSECIFCLVVAEHVISYLHCVLAAAQCIAIAPVCSCVGGSVTTITRNCVH